MCDQVTDLLESAHEHPQSCKAEHATLAPRALCVGRPASEASGANTNSVFSFCLASALC